jgi:membrane-associated phospholipid phosphatase
MIKTFSIKEVTAIHKLLVFYCLLTILISLSPNVHLANPILFYGTKFFIFSVILFWRILKKHIPLIGLNYLNAILGIGFLGFFYNETAQLNHILLKPIDSFLVQLEQFIFGFQPSIMFSATYHNIFIVELMNLGYFSYYFIIIGIVIVAMYRKPELYEKIVFVICQSFIIYYLIFIFIPSWGPQFFFASPITKVPEGFFFQKIIAFIQNSGEAATGAIPSSHVGITIIIGIISFRKFKLFFWCIFPFVILLICSTVYIKAHYLIDVIAGFVTAPLIYLLSQYVWNYLNKPKYIGENGTHSN